MTTRARLSGNPNEITAVIDALRNHFDLAGGERGYPNRGASGVRVYLEIRPRPTPGTRPERTHGSGEKGPTA